MDALNSLIRLFTAFVVVTLLILGQTFFWPTWTTKKHRTKELVELPPGAPKDANIYYNALDSSSTSALTTRAILEKAFGVDLGVFVCVTGQRGRLELDSKRQNLLRPLRDYFRTVDVAFVMSSGVIFANTGHGAEQSQPTPSYNLTLAVGDLVTGVADHNFLPPTDPVLNEAYMARMDKHPSTHSRRAQSHVSQWTMYLWCLDLMRNMESRRGRPYTHALRVRDDSFFPWPVAVPALAEVVAPISTHLGRRGWRRRPFWVRDGAISVTGLPPESFTHAPASNRIVLRPTGASSTSSWKANTTRSWRARVSRAAAVSEGVAAEDRPTLPFLQFRSEATVADVFARVKKLVVSSQSWKAPRSAAASGGRSRGRTATTTAQPNKAWKAPLRKVNQFAHHIASPQCDDSAGMNDKMAFVVRPAVYVFFRAPLVDLNVYFRPFHDVPTFAGYMNSEQLLQRAMVRGGLSVARVASQIVCPISSRYYGEDRWCGKMWLSAPGGLPCYADGNQTLADHMKQFACSASREEVPPDNPQRLFGIRTDVPKAALPLP
eukprot:TRINITY_DN669_c0_g1_i1.p1 TRINITY_DN669_c0_g1~~TRINITY_DN669_c0_g1_i1.p1  ORF type:complete len:547 (-),score=65.17 TRINITY_DN669_c0_g1_i1:361-2001(-)